MKDVLINSEIPRTMTLQGLEYLGRLAQAVPPGGLIVEVGPLFGSSTWVMAKNCHPSVRVISIDTWEPQPWIEGVEAKFPGCQPFSLDAFRHYTRDCPNVEAHQGWSPQVMAGWDEPIDLFFDDATHGNPGFRTSLDFYLPKLKPGGIAAGDDFASGWPDIVTEVYEQARQWQVQPEIVGRVWAMVKPETNGATTSVYKKVGPYTEHDLKIAVRLESGEELDDAYGVWAGRLHRSEPIVGVKVDWAEPRSDGLGGACQVRSLREYSDWVPFGGWAEVRDPIIAFRGRLTGGGSAGLGLAYQACHVLGTRKAGATRNTRAFRQEQWTALENPDLRIMGTSAIRCFVTDYAPGTATAESPTISFETMYRRAVAIHDGMAAAALDKDVLDDMGRLRSDLAALRADERGAKRQPLPEHLFQRFTAVLDRYDIREGVIAEIGGSNNSFMDRLPGFDARFLSMFPTPDPRFMVADITNCPHVPDESFDAIYSTSVLEHVTHLREAALEITRLLKPGGVTMHAVPFSYFFHGAPVDYWRVTTTAMENLFDQLETVECYFFNGNRRRNNLGSTSNPIDRDGGPMFKPDAFGGWRENWYTIYVGRKTNESVAFAAERRWRQTMVDLVKGFTERGHSEPEAVDAALHAATRLTFDSAGLVRVGPTKQPAPMSKEALQRAWNTRSARTVRPTVGRHNLMAILAASHLI